MTVSLRSPEEVPEDNLPEDLLLEEVEEEMFAEFENEGAEEEEDVEEHRREEIETDKKKSLDRGKQLISVLEARALEQALGFGKPSNFQRLQQLPVSQCYNSFETVAQFIY